MSCWHQYGTFFQAALDLLASAAVYIMIVLTTMQAGLAIKTLAENGAFQSASHGFTVFSLLGPLIAVVLVVLTFCYISVNNWAATGAYKSVRFRAIQARSETP
jgi:hypothetical protein